MTTPAHCESKHPALDPHARRLANATRGELHSYICGAMKPIFHRGTYDSIGPLPTFSPSGDCPQWALGKVRGSKMVGLLRLAHLRQARGLA